MIATWALPGLPSALPFVLIWQVAQSVGYIGAQHANRLEPEPVETGEACDCEEWENVGGVWICDEEYVPQPWPYETETTEPTPVPCTTDTDCEMKNPELGAY